LTGNGLNVGTAVVKVGGVNCKVTASSNTHISCTTEAASAASVIPGAYIGHHGISRTLVNSTSNTTKVHINTITNYANLSYPADQSILTAFSTGKDEGNYHGNILKGWFVAPETTEYRFFMACDDNCRLFLGKEPNKGPEVVNNTEKILEVWWASNYREYFRVDGQTRGSKWVNMTKGAHYYIETHHVEGGGGDHLNVAVEIKKTAATVVGHHHSLKEV